MLRCKACGSAVPNSKERRSLESPTSSSVRTALFHYSRKAQEETSSSTISEDHFSHGYACKKCFLLVQKCLSLKNKLMELEKDITGNLSSAFHLCEAQTVQGTKRSCSSNAPSTPKRMRLDSTPSSSVVVSNNHHNT